MDQAITDFIKDHHVMTLATVNAAGKPYCANLFYAYIPDGHIFVFTTDDETRHGSEMRETPLVAGSIVLETKTVGLVRGLQFQGVILSPDDVRYPKQAKTAYLKTFPYAALAHLNLRCCALTFAKYTDNRLGFGKKLVWNDEASTKNE